MTAVRFGYLRELMAGRLGRPLAGVRVLEIGCGGGYMSEHKLVPVGPIVTMTDARNVCPWP